MTLSGPAPSHLDLMGRRVAAMYRHDARGRLLSLNQWDGGVAPRFHLGRTVSGAVWRFRADIPDDLAGELERLCKDEHGPCEARARPVHHDAYIRLLSSHAPVERVSAGPAYTFPRDVPPAREPAAITEENADLLSGGLEDWLPDVPHRHPFLAMVEDGRAVSVCASVRITDAAHEAGVETLPDYRRRGHAANAVAGWAAAVRKMGAMPFYSASWDNIASQAVARRLALSMLGVDFSIT